MALPTDEEDDFEEELELEDELGQSTAQRGQLPIPIPVAAQINSQPGGGVGMGAHEEDEALLAQRTQSPEHVGVPHPALANSAEQPVGGSQPYMRHSPSPSMAAVQSYPLEQDSHTAEEEEALLAGDVIEHLQLDVQEETGQPVGVQPPIGHRLRSLPSHSSPISATPL